MELPDRIKATRRRIGLTQDEFAEKVGTSQKVVSRWEKGVKPRGNMLEKIAEAGNVTYNWIAFGTGEVDDAAILSREERNLLDLYRGIEEKRVRYELMARFENALGYTQDIKSLERRISAVFFDQDKEAQGQISICLKRRIMDYYDQLASVQAVSQELSEEYEQGFLGKDVISNLENQVTEIQRDIDRLRRFDRAKAIEEITQLVREDIDITILLEELEPGEHI